MVATANAAHRTDDELLAAGGRFLAGTDWQSAAAKALTLAGTSIDCNIGWLAGEAKDEASASHNTARYAQFAAALGELPPGTWLEADAPHLGVDVSTDLCLHNLRTVAGNLPAGRFIQVGAEDATRTDSVLATVLAAHREGLPVRATVQANLRRSERDVEKLVRAGTPVRLVKGGFAETSATAFQSRAEIDAVFVRLARRIRDAGTPLSLATHDARMWDRLLPVTPGATVELLLGVLPDEARRLRASGVPVRLYTPFGSDWRGYVAKRISDEAALTPLSDGADAEEEPECR
ncbi:proline dehydrogenase family protein [Streptomyces sp. WMMB 322]|uniref:proline dehydrogenase family protein n=1 Tax=Streptomyces sp. WMMB 322 TaxID=1286821 RepID=UPI0006E13698|nr:proline dehydrogenase family protein [Streptomyces sp. WMMB 322]SCK10818.1 L-proline dehydrogenase [Streptomyces sp. WMMB 322]